MRRIKRFNRITAMLRYFDDREHFARFIGVSERTVRRWEQDPHSLSMSALRFMYILERMELEAPELYNALIERYRN